jgi:D-glycero-D-manno-heptose 1,7-bisphosphate phosphatase
MPPICTILLDRDGVINRNRSDYVKSWAEFQFLPGARAAIAQLTRAGYRLFVVTNQACVGKGLVAEETLRELHRRMTHELGRAGGRVETVLCCAHRAGDGCGCRKPAPGLLLRARDLYGVDLDRALFIGDSAGDMQAAAAAGVRAMLVCSGLGWGTARQLLDTPELNYQIALNLPHATRLILAGNARQAGAPRQAPWLRGLVAGAHALESQGLWASARTANPPRPLSAPGSIRS